MLAAAPRMVGAFFQGAADGAPTPALLDSAPLGSPLARSVDFAGIPKNLDERFIKALAIAAFVQDEIRLYLSA